MHDLAILIVSHGDAPWLGPCLASLLARTDDLDVDVVIIENGPTDDVTLAALRRRFHGVRTLRCPNRGFAHANNLGLATCDARYVLFLNPDTEVIDGSLDDLVTAMELRPGVGLVGVRQVDATHRLLPTIGYPPNALRALGRALFVDRWPRQPRLLSEANFDARQYDHEQRCAWTAGSFMLARLAPVLEVGGLDERFFLYSEEPDLCLRMRRLGWETCHLPLLTVVHHGRRMDLNARLHAQHARSSLLYADKHFSRPHRWMNRAALLLHHAVRWVAAMLVPHERVARHAMAARSILTVMDLVPAPFQPPCFGDSEDDGAATPVPRSRTRRDVLIAGAALAILAPIWPLIARPSR